MKTSRLSLAFAVTILATGCGDDTDPATDGGADASFDAGTDSGLDGGTASFQYAFESRFSAGQDSVDRAGQTARQQLILRVKSEYQRISDAVKSGNASRIDNLCAGGDCSTGDLIISTLLGNIYNGTGLTGVDVPYSPVAPDSLCDPSNDGSLTHDDLSTTASIREKLAGNDDVTDFRDWDGDMQDDNPSTNQDSQFEGFSENSELVDESGVEVTDISSPEKLLLAFFSTFHHACAECIENASNCPDGNTPLFTTAGGLDLQQLSEKLLHTAVSFSQTADDYLDDATPAKGLVLGNATERMKSGSGKGDTELAHVWDEGFGYFGGSIDYLDYSDADIRASGPTGSAYRNGYYDTNGNSCIDIASEVNLGVAVNAAKRDLGSTTGTDFTTDLFEAFWRGRNLIHTTERDLTSAELDTLRGYRDTIVSTWEQVIAATAIHYINEVKADLQKCGTTSDPDPANNFSLADVAKHWSELKGFALGLQFNPRSPWQQASNDFAALHSLIGDAPSLCQGAGSDQVPSAYITDLEGARSALQTAYGFSTADVEGW